jgi:hypothetical protein
MNILLLLFRLLLLPASICAAILMTVGIGLLAKWGVVHVNAANQDGMAIGLLILFFGVPALVTAGWLISKKFQSDKRALSVGNAVQTVVIAWVVIELIRQSGLA